MQAEITHRRVLAVALPIVLSNITVPLLGVVDTFAVGQIGDAASIAAVGVGAIILGAIYWIFGFLRMGTTGLAAQAIGGRGSAGIDRPFGAWIDPWAWGGCCHYGALPLADRWGLMGFARI
jgi:Na+-driven multidrug efflux pump